MSVDYIAVLAVIIEISQVTVTFAGTYLALFGVNQMSFAASRPRLFQQAAVKYAVIALSLALAGMATWIPVLTAGTLTGIHRSTVNTTVVCGAISLIAMGHMTYFWRRILVDVPRLVPLHRGFDRFKRWRSGPMGPGTPAPWSPGHVPW